MSDVALGDLPLRALQARLGEPVSGEDRELLAEVIAEHNRLVPQRSASR